MTEHTEPSMPEDREIPPMTAERLRSLIVLSLAEHEDVVACRPVGSIYSDRLALAVEDREGALWRIHVLTEARLRDDA